MKKPGFWGCTLQIAKRELVMRQAGSVLGFLWNFAQPLLLILVFSLVFSRVVFPGTSGIEGKVNYGIFLASGLLPWRTFTSTLTRTVTAYPGYGKIILNQPVPLLSIPMGVTLLNSFILLLVYPILLGFAIFQGIPPNPMWLALPLIIALQQIMAMSLGLMLGSIHLFFRDIGAGLGFVLRLWFWITPIAYRPRILRLGGGEEILKWNPFAYVVECYRSVVFEGFLPGPAFLTAGAFTLCVVLIAAIVQRRTSRYVADML